MSKSLPLEALKFNSSLYSNAHVSTATPHGMETKTYRYANNGKGEKCLYRHFGGNFVITHKNNG